MSTFETLIFIPEGSLLNQKLAEKTALRQALKHFGLDWGPAERLRYTSLQKQFKSAPCDGSRWRAQRRGDGGYYYLRL